MGNQTLDQRPGANFQKPVFAEICCKLLAFFSFFAVNTLKMTVKTSVWSAQHPNAGRNIQQTIPQKGVVGKFRNENAGRWQPEEDPT